MALAFSCISRQLLQGAPFYVSKTQQWPAHDEGQHPAGVRLRLIFTAAAEAAAIEQIALFPVISVAEIQRQQPLLALELVLSQTPSDAALQQLQQLTETEYLLITQNTPLPALTVPGLLVMDMDSTAIQIECIDELAAAAGVGKEVAEVTERAMQGELDFEQSLRARVAKLKGADRGIVEALCARLPLSPGLETMLAELQAHQWRTVVASGGFTPFVGHLKQLLGFDAAYANELVFADGKFTGEVTGKVVDAQFKADTVLRCAAEWQISAAQTMAIGDGANDIPMVEAAAFGVAYHAKPKLAAAADAAITQLGLQVLPYYLQR
ncbi:phosphoserine phosphatase SerB [Shewanella avicenniae]|uniref:Phosphoserine phosphatase n=1 Tax=Shewanella avicenniae TaxID=2814294 RepID=A0ABX7QQC0_9GAMM|nr:phosphoserine phosphatase SerB [Shewanella avicenniae]QSX32886.1 phosphoserine phosphatase SerB [Shewanella avicenniae]